MPHNFRSVIASGCTPRGNPSLIKKKRISLPRYTKKSLRLSLKKLPLRLFGQFDKLLEQAA